MSQLLLKRGGAFLSPAFFREIQTLKDIYLDKKQRFDPSIIISGKLCEYGHIQVITCRPLSEKLRPFPTTFWLTCPHLIKRAGTVESCGGVHELEEYIQSHALHNEWQKYNFLHQILKLKLLNLNGNENICLFMRKYHNKIFKSLIRSGIGGIKLTGEKDNINIKCLHLQTASYLGLGFHPACEWLDSKGLCGENCGKNLCSEKFKKLNI